MSNRGTARRHQSFLSKLVEQFVGRDDPRWLQIQGRYDDGSGDWKCEELARDMLSGGLLMPDINWALTCQKLGKQVEYVDFANTNRWIDPNLWIIPPFLRSISCNLVVDKMRNDGVKFSLWYDDIDAKLEPLEVTTSPVGFLRNIEADEENKDKSAEMLFSENFVGISLPERLVLGAGYFWTTGKHLDIRNVTLCAGSRWRDGLVPHVRFRDGGVYVRGCNPRDHYPDLRARSAVPQQVA